MTDLKIELNRLPDEFGVGGRLQMHIETLPMLVVLYAICMRFSMCFLKMCALSSVLATTYLG